MAFSQSAISDVQIKRQGTTLQVSWSSSASAGTVYQVYLARRLAWHGLATQARLPWPGGTRVTLDVGTVGAGEDSVDFSASLPSTPGTGNRAILAWRGGTYLSPTIAGFNVYSSLAAGGSISYTTPVGFVAAYPGGVILDGFGLGGFGLGGFGLASSDYSWESGPLANGVWPFGIVGVDAAGNLAGTPVTTSVTISAPPRPPAANSAGARLTYSYNATTHLPVLTWLAAPT